MALVASDREIRGVLFDWGDTLVRPPGITTDSEGHFACVEAFFREDLPQKFPPAQTADHAMWTAFRQNYETVARAQIRATLESGREHSFEQRFARTLALTFPAAAPDARALDWMATRFGTRIAGESSQIKDAEHVLPRLRRHLKLGLLSNYPHAPAVYASLERYGLRSHLDVTTVSSEIGWAKPDHRAFAHTIDLMGISAEQLLFVGDDLVNDMQGAKAYGMHTAWLPRRGHSGQFPFVDVTLTGLTDLVDVLIGAIGTPRLR